METKPIELFLFSNDADEACAAQQAGIDGIVVDWENTGKKERQAGYDTECNNPCIESLKSLSNKVDIPILLRINALSPNTEQEIQLAVDGGANLIVLPMAGSAKEVERFIEILSDRAVPCIMIENVEILRDLDVLQKLPWEYAFIGFNDLMITRSGNFIWEPVIDGTLELIFSKLPGRKLGFGGITLVDKGSPIPFKLLANEMSRLGCHFSFLRRSFKRDIAGHDINKEIFKIREFWKQCQSRNPATVKAESNDLKQRLTLLKNNKNNSKKLLLMYSSHKPSDAHIAAIEQRLGKGSVSIAKSEKDAQEKAADAEIIWGHRYLRQVMPHAEKIRWVQSTAGGVDRLPLQDLARKKITLTRNASDAPIIARHAHSMAWCIIRAIPQCIKNQDKHLYERKLPFLPMPEKVLIFGTGAIGKRIGNLFKNEGLSVYGVNRSGHTANGFDKIFPDGQWHSVLPEIDIMILALPLNNKTRNLIDHNALTRLPNHAIIINIGRLETLDFSALCSLLKMNKLGGAGIDVYEPFLEKDDPVWDVPGLMLTPYIASFDTQRSERIESFFIEQLDRYLSEESLQNRVSFSTNQNHDKN